MIFAALLRVELDADIIAFKSEFELGLLTLFSRLYVNNNRWKKKKRGKHWELEERKFLLDHLFCTASNPAKVTLEKCENLIC